jgi:hypothetical protein
LLIIPVIKLQSFTDSARIQKRGWNISKPLEK